MYESIEYVCKNGPKLRVRKQNKAKKEYMTNRKIAKIRKKIFRYKQ